MCIRDRLEILARNYNYRNKSAKLFELGKTYLPNGAGELPDEPQTLMLGMYGGVDFYDIKGVCEEIFEKLHIKNAEFEAVSDDPVYHPGRAARIKMCIRDRLDVLPCGHHR